jgi:hypothetical protein
MARKSGGFSLEGIADFRPVMDLPIGKALLFMIANGAIKGTTVLINRGLGIDHMWSAALLSVLFKLDPVEEQLGDISELASTFAMMDFFNRVQANPVTEGKVQTMVQNLLAPKAVQAQLVEADAGLGAAPAVAMDESEAKLLAIAGF